MLRLVPFERDVVAPGFVAVQGCDEAKQASIGAVSKQVDPNLDTVAGSDVLGFNPVLKD